MTRTIETNATDNHPDATDKHPAGRKKLLKVIGEKVTDWLARPNPREIASREVDAEALGLPSIAEIVAAQQTNGGKSVSVDNPEDHGLQAS